MTKYQTRQVYSISQTKRAVKHLKEEGIIDVKRACIQDTKCTRAAISAAHFKFKQIKDKWV